MIFRILLLQILALLTANCHDSSSIEVNKIEMTPFYDTIIFSDVADILNELENGMNPLETLFNSASDSEENLEDLLFEYQHYLDRAHKQRMNYLEKTKTKNKVPLTRHDRFSKVKPAGSPKYDNFFYSGSYLNANKLPQAQYGSPLDVFMPMNEKMRYMAKTNLNTALPSEEGTFEKRVIELTPLLPKPRYDPVKPSCFCKSAQLPCDCKCKQCYIYDGASKNYYPYPKYFSGNNDKGYLPNADYVSDDKLSDDNTLNIRVKVDIQLPQSKDIFTKLIKNRSREELNSKETSVSIPFPYFNFPIPMDLLGYKAPSKANSYDPTHKITIHKKKKARVNNGNKKHRKKLIAFHNLNLRPQHAKIQPYYDETTNTTIDFNENITENSSRTASNSTIVPTTQVPEPLNNINNTIALVSNNKDNSIPNNETQPDESIYVTVNISNNSENFTEDIRKTENSVETEFTKIDKVTPTEKLLMLRKKRDTSTSKPLSNTVDTTKTKSELVKKYIAPNTTSPPKSNNDNKKSDKVVLADSELEYWPINKNLTDYTSNNITTIILEREDKKSKLNMTKEAIRNNRSTILEKAIFGDVNWDDVDTVAPVFLSFVGKYIRGVLTFCSENVCHSMKCAEKTCVHRICHPSDRWNQRGHCAGSNKTDSIASLESIMDLPSNVAFEIVDILRDKMLGKLFGKVTVCINSKCITFIAVKKSFLKSKCSMKDLKIGHCPNIKNSKIM